MAPVLETRGLGVRFGGHAAVDGVSCGFHAGTVTAIVGPNGAGKTTFFNLVSGQVAATTGQVLLEGRDISRLGVADRARLGLGRAFQLTQLFPRLTVFENVRLAVQSRTGGGMQLHALWSDHRNALERTHQLLERVRLHERAEVPAASLPHGDQRKLEVAMLMALRPKVYLFDEPTAGMSADDAPVVLELIQAIRQDPSRTVLLVEHKMDVVRELADRIVVLHEGRLVADGEPAQVMRSAIVQQAYLGTAPRRVPAA